MKFSPLFSLKLQWTLYSGIYRTIFTITLFVVLFLLFSQVRSQTEWTYYPDNPVLKLGQQGAWDALWMEPMSVVYDGTQYRMWYLSYSQTWSPVIGHAVSPDGVNWSKFDENPILTKGEAGTWDGEFIGAGCVLLMDSTYYLWFYGQNSAIAQFGIGLATSSDGIHWTENENNPIYVPNDPGNWDDAATGINPCVVFDGERYHMWYEATSGQPAQGAQQPMWQIGYACSDDGIHWEACPNNPVLTIGKQNSWDGWTAMNATVVKTGSGFHMWYYGDNAKSQIGYAHSLDGMNWTKYVHNPVLSPCLVGSWNLIGLMRPVVLYDKANAAFKMWYCGGGMSNNNLAAEIGYATAPDVTVGVVNNDPVISADCFSLYPNYPNPFNPSTTIEFECTVQSAVRLDIFDISGRHVKTLMNNQLPAGHYRQTWYADDHTGNAVPAGMYFARLKAGNMQQHIKLTLIR